MVLGAMTSAGNLRVHRISDSWNAKDCVDILINELIHTLWFVSKNSDRTLNQHCNDPKHTSLLVKYLVLRNDISVLKWPIQIPDLNGHREPVAIFEKQDEFKC